MNEKFDFNSTPETINNNQYSNGNFDFNSGGNVVPNDIKYGGLTGIGESINNSNLSKNIVNTIGSTVKDYANSVYSSYSNLPNKIVSNINRGADFAQKGDTAGVLYTGALSAGDTLGAVYSPITSAVSTLLEKTGIQKNIDKVAQSIVDKSGIADIPAVQKFAMENPNAESDFGSLSNLALLLGGKTKLNEKIDTNKIATDIKTLPNQLQEPILNAVSNKIPEIKTAFSNLPNRIGLTKTDIQKRDILGKELENTINNYNSSSYLYSDIKKAGGRPLDVFMAYGNKSLPNFLENGKITADSISEPIAYLKNQIKSLSEIKSDTLFLNNSKITGPQYIKYSKDLVDSQNWSNGKKKLIKEQIDKLFKKELSASFPRGGAELKEIDKIKTEQTDKSKSYNNKSNKFEYDTHGILGKSARQLVELFDDSQSTKDLNNWVQSHYNAIDLLESLVGKTPHGGKLTRLVNSSVGSIVGSVVGENIGHPIIGFGIGRAIANQIDGVLNNHLISNPLKRLLIKDIESKNPSIVSEIEKYIKANQPDISELGNYSLVPKNQLKSSITTIPKTTKNIKPISKIVPPNTIKKQQ